MVRYFFHIVNGTSAYSDKNGLRFPSAEQARGHAAVVVREYAGDGGWDGWSIRVVDERDAEIALLPISSPIPRP